MRNRLFSRGPFGRAARRCLPAVLLLVVAGCSTTPPRNLDDSCAIFREKDDWYGNMSHRLLGISRWDGYRQYLAYHEGHGGYRRGTYRGKPWLMRVARKVDGRAKRYHTQLSRCREELESWGLWPF